MGGRSGGAPFSWLAVVWGEPLRTLMSVTIDGTPAPLLPIWSANQTTRVHLADPPRVHTVTPPTPPIPPRGLAATDTVEIPFEDVPEDEPIEEESEDEPIEDVPEEDAAAKLATKLRQGRS